MAAFTNKEKEYIIRMIKEAREELDALERQMAEQEKEKEEEGVGFEDDEIFLLSKEEFERCRDKIPAINCWWWLRSPGRDSAVDVAGVYSVGNVDEEGWFVRCKDSAIRPALKLKGEYNVGERIVLYSFPWIVIDKNLAVAEVPIGFGAFNVKKTNDYRSSDIRLYLQCWLKDRSETSNVNCKEF